MRGGGMCEQVKEGQPTFEDIYNSNREVDVSMIEAASLKAHRTLRDEIKVTTASV